MSDLVWDERGWGFLEPDVEFEYGEDYWKEFRTKDDTSMGRVLTAVRANLVRKWFVETRYSHALDVGIGGGAFVDEMGCWGTDVNLKAREWLRGSLWGGASVDVMTMWDVIEHLRDPREILRRALHLVFVSTPIYGGAEDCMKSKHFKPGEHLWYFEDRGLKNLLGECGFTCVDQNRIEEDAGRTEIGTYVFKRT